MGDKQQTIGAVAATALYIAFPGAATLQGAIQAATLGASVGGAFSKNVIDAPKEGPGFKMQTAAYGTPIPRTYGWDIITGNIIWALPEPEVYETEEEVAKGTYQVTKAYYHSFTISLGEGPIDRIGRVWLDDVLVGRIADFQTNIDLGLGFKLTNVSPRNRYITRLNEYPEIGEQDTFFYINLHPGAEDEPISGFLRDAVETYAPGEGLDIPNYRGTALLSFVKLPLRLFGNRIPTVRVEVFRQRVNSSLTSTVLTDPFVQNNVFQVATGETATVLRPWFQNDLLRNAVNDGSTSGTPLWAGFHAFTGSWGVFTYYDDSSSSTPGDYPTGYVGYSELTYHYLDAASALYERSGWQKEIYQSHMLPKDDITYDVSRDSGYTHYFEPDSTDIIKLYDFDIPLIGGATSTTASDVVILPVLNSKNHFFMYTGAGNYALGIVVGDRLSVHMLEGFSPTYLDDSSQEQTGFTVGQISAGVSSQQLIAFYFQGAVWVYWAKPEYNDAAGTGAGWPGLVKIPLVQYITPTIQQFQSTDTILDKTSGATYYPATDYVVTSEPLVNTKATAWEWFQDDIVGCFPSYQGLSLFVVTTAYELFPIVASGISVGFSYGDIQAFVAAQTSKTVGELTFEVFGAIHGDFLFYQDVIVQLDHIGSSFIDAWEPQVGNTPTTAKSIIPAFSSERGFTAVPAGSSVNYFEIEYNIDTTEFELSGRDLAGVVSHELERTGFFTSDDYDVTDLVDVVPYGITITNGGGVLEALSPLLTAHFIDVYEEDYKLKFVRKAGKGKQEVILKEDLKAREIGQDVPEMTITRKPLHKLPSSLDFSFKDAVKNGEPGVEFSSIPYILDHHKQQANTQLLMTPGQAVRVADILLKVLYHEASMLYEFDTTFKYSHLEVGHLIGVQTDDTTTPVATYGDSNFVEKAVVTGTSGLLSYLIKEGDYLYATSDTSDRLFTASVEDTENPVLVDTWVNPDSSGLEACAVKRNRLYAQAGGTGNRLYVFDITDPASPSQIGKIAMSGLEIVDFWSNASSPANTMHVHGEWLITGFRDQDVVRGIYTGPGVDYRPFDSIYSWYVQDITIPGTPEGGAIDGDYFYITHQATGGVSIIDISDMFNLSIASTTVTSATTPNAVAVAAGHIYVAHSGSGNLDAYDISNPASPTLVQTINIDDSISFPFTNGGRIIVAGDFLILNDAEENFLAVNIQTPSDMVVVHDQIGTDYVGNMVLDYGYIYSAQRGRLSVWDTGVRSINTNPDADVPIGTTSLRIVDIAKGRPGLVKIKAVPETPGIIRSGQITDETLPIGAVVQIASTFNVIVIDSLPFKENEDTVGYWVGVWPHDATQSVGTSLIEARKNGRLWDFTQLLEINSKATIGVCTTALTGSRTPAMYDQTDTLTVQILSGTLATVTEEQASLGANTFFYGNQGRWEIIKALTVVDNGDNTYTLSNILGGYKGTEYLMDTHISGDYLVLINSALTRLEIPYDELGVSKDYRLQDINQEFENWPRAYRTISGLGRKPLPPAHLNAYRDGDNTWNIDWVPQARTGINWINFSETSPDESAELYYLDFLDANDDRIFQATGVTTRSYQYTEEEQKTYHWGVQETIRVAVRQFSNRVGLGIATKGSFTAPPVTPTAFSALNPGGLGVDWTPYALPNNNQFSDLAYGNGVWIGVSLDGSGTARCIRSTDDGENWTSINMPSALTYQAIATDGAGTWIAVASDSPGGTPLKHGARSTDDGLNWSLVDLPEDNTYRDVMYGGGVWIAISQDGTNPCARSTDGGATWTAVSMPDALAYISVNYGNNVWIVVGGGGAARSTNGGQSWVSVSLPQNISPTTINYGNVAYGNGVWLAVSVTASGYVVRSIDDGVSWSQHRLPQEAPYGSIAYGAGTWLAGGSSIGDPAGSIDGGITWGTISMPEETTAYFGNIAFGNSLWVALTSDGLGYAAVSS